MLLCGVLLALCCCVAAVMAAVVVAAAVVAEVEVRAPRVAGKAVVECRAQRRRG